MNSEEIKKTYSMRDILGRYGMQPNRAGFICCPFHKEKTASMKIYQDSYYCFGCGAHGDIFDFVSQMEDITFREAFFNLGGTYEQKKETFGERMRGITPGKSGRCSKGRKRIWKSGGKSIAS